jgi:SM-20-related protein
VERAFESIITSFLKNRVGLIDNFLNEELSSKLKENLLLLLFKKQLKVAGIGNNSKFLTNKSIRSDHIYWLDRKHNNIHENRFFDLIDEFVQYLNKTCYTGITGYEFHYAYYDKGSSYKRHLDQFQDNSNRAYSMIMYLNSNWIPSDGGQLCIYHQDNSQIISPINGKCVFFKSSELEHEVLLNQNPRMSITGWLTTN